MQSFVRYPLHKLRPSFLKKLKRSPIVSPVKRMSGSVLKVGIRVKRRNLSIKIRFFDSRFPLHKDWVNLLVLHLHIRVSILSIRNQPWLSFWIVWDHPRRSLMRLMEQFFFLLLNHCPISFLLSIFLFVLNIYNSRIRNILRL